MLFFHLQSNDPDWLFFCRHLHLPGPGPGARVGVLAEVWSGAEMPAGEHGVADRKEGQCLRRAAHVLALSFEMKELAFQLD